MITLDKLGILKIYSADLFETKFNWIDPDDRNTYVVKAISVNYDNDSVMIEVSYPEATKEEQVNLPLYINYDLLTKI